VNNQWKRFVEKHIVADDPNPEYSNLDREDGLPAKVVSDLLYQDYAEAPDPMPSEEQESHIWILPVGVGSHAG